DLELKRFGSQGQHKTFQIALRFAQFFYLKDKLAKTPMFLMDDVFGELDKSRAFRISNYISEIGQSFITLTDLTSIENLKINNGTLIIEVNNGNTVVA
ncbi:MAG: DNA replication and repair protein RecF, partial [Ignavibacteria bacterium]|nr:DNA replication and repair protein RecF [Ignavibacteria bacterium]